MRKSDEMANEIVAILSGAINGKNEEAGIPFDLREYLAPDEDGNIEATDVFEALLTANAYLYRKMVDSDADVIDYLGMMHRLVTQRAVQDERNRFEQGGFHD